MIKYRGTYRVMMPLDSNGATTKNPDDTYTPCRSKIQIYRHDVGVLAIQFPTFRVAENRVPIFAEYQVYLEPHQITDLECTYLFTEREIHKVAEIVGAWTMGANKSPVKTNRSKSQRVLSEEEKDILIERLKRGRETIERNKSKHS